MPEWRAPGEGRRRRPCRTTEREDLRRTRTKPARKGPWRFGVLVSEGLTLDDTVGRRPRCVLAVAADWRGGQSATRHLIGLGHRRIAMIGGLDTPSCRARLSGHSSALTEAGLPTHPDLTTVHQPPAEMTAATELALALGRGEEVPQIGLEIATTLVIRESTAPLTP